LVVSLGKHPTAKASYYHLTQRSLYKSQGEMPSRDKQVPGPMALGKGKPERETHGCQAP